jgi:hypothetical protein
MQISTLLFSSMAYFLQFTSPNRDFSVKKALEWVIYVTNAQLHGKNEIHSKNSILLS